MKKSILPLVFICATVAGSSTTLASPMNDTSPSFPLDAEHWIVKDGVTFAKNANHPVGEIVIKDGAATTAKDMMFGSGTIEFDVKPIGDGMPGIRFRKRDEDTAEEFYLRPFEDCSQSNECAQYTPRTHGNMLWDVYPQYQSSSPINVDGWNHVKLVISGHRMKVYINDRDNASINVGKLEGDSMTGSIEFTGPAAFANIVIAKDAVEGLSANAVPDQSDADKRYVGNWSVTKPEAQSVNESPIITEALSNPAAWQAIPTESHGLVNLSRQYGRPLDKTVAMVWVKTHVHAEHDVVKHVSFGWAREAWVFVNGKMAFNGKNFYYPAKERQSPDGRLSLQNGGFDMPLHAGDNEIMVAVGNVFGSGASRYGWGMEMRFDNLDGVSQASATSSNVKM